GYDDNGSLELPEGAEEITFGNVLRLSRNSAFAYKKMAQNGVAGS
ncbi:MAG: hypothetical protein QOJ51_6908, partial [Acidobacteriaceae bacterium]|nr:hypothetical protein [Acidobacteriaceae bacterium]